MLAQVRYIAAWCILWARGQLLPTHLATRVCCRWHPDESPGTSNPSNSSTACICRLQARRVLKGQLRGGAPALPGLHWEG